MRAPGCAEQAVDRLDRPATQRAGRGSRSQRTARQPRVGRMPARRSSATWTTWSRPATAGRRSRAAGHHMPATPDRGYHDGGTRRLLRHAAGQTGRIDRDTAWQPRGRPWRSSSFSSDSIRRSRRPKSSIWLAPRTSAADLISKAAELEWLYGVPFRLVSLSQKDRATAKMNVGASLATSPNLLFMSPDVFADSPGWLGTLLAFQADKTDVGAVGPEAAVRGRLRSTLGRLLRPCVTAGAEFARAPGAWLVGASLPLQRNARSVRGRQRGVPRGRGIERGAADRARPVRAGRGLSRTCSSAATTRPPTCACGWGKPAASNWYLPDAKLHYLEGRSESEVSVRPSRYDVMLHSQLWGKRIEELADPASPLATSRHGEHVMRAPEGFGEDARGTLVAEAPTMALRARCRNRSWPT